MASKIGTEIIKVEGGGEQFVVPSAELSVTAGPDKGICCAVQSAVTVVGTDPSCDLRLTDSAVSQRQFELQTTSAGWVLRDLGSTNGTHVGSLRVHQVLLSEPTQLQLGRTRIRFSPTKKTARYPLSDKQRFGTLLGKSSLMRRAFALLERAAATDDTVLIEGESGTGKELAAASLHQASARAQQPYVVVDCGAVAPALIESELFGHEQGAFTGATCAKAGAFECAEGGTVFLDEIGELALDLQPKLLRFLESHETRRVGSTTMRTVDVRVVAATNRSLERLVREQRFRQDLFYRLAVLRVQLPPLRMREEDVSLLALELGQRLQPTVDPDKWLPPSTLEILRQHRWPGNVRELRNVLQRFALLPEIDPALLLDAGDDTDQNTTQWEALGNLPYHEAKERVLQSFERKYVLQLLDQEEGVVARAATKAGYRDKRSFG